MKELVFQQKAVRKLVDMTIDLLGLTGHRKTLIFKTPTKNIRDWYLSRTRI